MINGENYKVYLKILNYNQAFYYISSGNRKQYLLAYKCLENSSYFYEILTEVFICQENTHIFNHMQSNITENILRDCIQL